MNTRLFCLSVAALVCVVCSTVLPGVARDQTSEDPTPALTRQYAESYLKLAELQLHIRRDANRKLPNLFSTAEIERYEMNVKVAKEQLRLVIGYRGDAIELHLNYAQGKASVAEADYQRALKAQDTLTPPIYGELQIKEFQLKAEVARLRLAVWSNPGTSVLSLLDHVHWQIERVSEEVLDLQKRVDKLDHE